MEVTNGLLSNLVQTKSIERVLAPIASQISLLIILDESNDGVSCPDSMVPCAESVMKAAENLIAVGKERAQNSADQYYRTQMSSACEILDLSSSNLYIASQRLAADNRKDVRNKVISAAKDVLQGTMKVLLVSDDAEVRKVVSSANLVTESVNRLNAVQSMPDLLTNFKSFTDAAAVLSTLANKRQRELSHNRQREKVITALSLLRKSIPSLSVALQSYIKYPSNVQAQLSKSCVTDQVLSAVRDIVEAVENKFTDDDCLDVEEPGSFVTNIDQILNALAVEGRFDLSKDLETWSEGIVRHSMLVAHLCTDLFRDIIIKTSQRILQLKTRVSQLFTNLQSNQELESLRNDYEECCETLIDEFCELEKDVNLALLHLIVDIFKETTEPLERLVKFSMYSGEVQMCDHERDGFIEDYQSHADKMCQISRFAAASSTDAKRVRIIRTCVCHLERLDPDIVPAVIAMAKRSHDKMAVKHVKLLMKQWSLELTTLIQVLDEMTDPRIFMEVSEKKVEEDIATCRGFLLSCDDMGLAASLRSVVDRSRRVCQMAQRIVDSSADPMYRNGLQAYIVQLQKATTGIKIAGNNAVEDMENQAFADTLLKRFGQLLDRVGQVKAGLDKENQPDIMSPLRRNLRQTAIRNIRVKNESTKKSSPNKAASPSKKSSILKSSGELREDIVMPTRQERMLQSAATPSYTTDSATVITNEGETSMSRKLVQRLAKAAASRDRQRVNVICGELLGWTNHIVDTAQSVMCHLLANKKSSIQPLCNEVDGLTPDIIEKSKLVVLGDQEEKEPLTKCCSDWSFKIEKLRILVDVAVDKYKTIPDSLIDAIIGRNNQGIAKEVEAMKTHRQCMCDVVALTEDLKVQTDKHIDLILRVEENKEEMENLTITMATTADSIIKAATEDEINQLEQLGREWAVVMHCIVGDLENLTSEIYIIGGEKKIWPSQDDALFGDENLLQHLKNENARLKRILHGACLGSENKGDVAQGLCENLDKVYDDIKSTLTNRKSTSSQKSGVVIATYIPLKVSILSACWIVQAEKCLDLLQEQTSLYIRPINQLTDMIFSAKAKTTAKERQTGLSEFQLKLSKLSENLIKVRQKTLSAIQLSTEIDKRATVRKCLDNMTESSSALIQTIKLLTDDSTSVKDKMEEMTKQKQEWGANVRQLMVSLQQIGDIRPSLVSDLATMLGMESLPEGKVTLTESENVTLAGNSKPSGTLDTVSMVTGDTDFKPAKVNFQTVHEELLQVTRDKQEEMAIGRFPKPQKPNSTSSPYKTPSSILSAARYLKKEGERWEDDCNPVVQVAKEMSLQVQHMAEYCFGEGPISSHQEMIATALALAANGEKMMKFAKLLATYCVDQSFGVELSDRADRIPTIAKQLTILANVQLSSPEDRGAYKILVQNARNLLKVVRQTVEAAEAVCVKGLSSPENGDEDDVCAIILATQWQRRLISYRQKEAEDADIDNLGLRRTDDHRPPTLTQIFERS